ncbi:MAG: PIG-L family deacetylase [Vicinamibacterales bacterium]
MRRLILSTALLLLVFTIGPGAQHQLQPVAALRGQPALELALRKLDTVGTFMMTTAHPDDENNAMLAYFAHGKGYRATLVTATHGEGGQNEIGPELFEALAVLRTEELHAAHQFDGAEQYFTRAIDFGYSFSVEETLDKWGHEEILGDFVRLIRTIRPDVIVGWIFDGEGGGQHHQTSARLTLEAFRAAADPNRFPEQITRDGLRAWQPKKYYYTAGFGGFGGGAPRAPQLTGEGATTPLRFTNGGDYDEVLGRTYDEIAAEARSMHKCQGVSQILPLPGPSARFYRLRDTVLPDGVNRADVGIFDGVDTRLVTLAGYAGAAPPAALTAGLEAITKTVADARAALAAGGNANAVAPLARGITAVRDLRAGLGAMGLSDDARYEIDFRLKQKEEQFAEALELAADIRLEAVANDGLVVGGQPVEVTLAASRRSDAAATLGAVTIAGLEGSTTACATGAIPGPNGALTCKVTATIPAGARLTAAYFHTGTDAARYVFDDDVPFGLPFRPTPYTATFTVNVGGVEIARTLPIEHRSEGSIFSGEKRSELHVVPKFSVTASPGVVVMPTGGGATREVRVTVENHGTGAAQADVRLVLPAGWSASPASSPVSFTREDEARTVRFTLTPPANLQPGHLDVKASVVEGGRTYAQGYQVIEYPHTTRRHVLRTPDVRVSALDLKVKPGLRIGYVMGVGDEVPGALEQIGATVEFIGADDLAWGDLSHYDVIMTGVRAYERRSDLRAYNQRLIDYARSGGTVIVNYNKFEFNQAQYGPYPAKVGRDRVTDENAPVTLLEPGNPVFNTPNKLTPADWQGWKQERGLYFLDTANADPNYKDLVEFDEPFPYNKGLKRGALVEATVGKGRWIYLGIGLWRQLPAGTDGAFRLMANLVSLGEAPGGAETAAAPKP